MTKHRFYISFFLTGLVILGITPTLIWGKTSKNFSDLKLIRSLIPNNQDLAHMSFTLPLGYHLPQASSKKINPKKAKKEARRRFKFAQKNYVLKDLNGDRYKDLLVITDQGPCLNFSIYSDRKKEDDKCSLNRYLHLYLGTSRSHFKHQWTNSYIIMNITDGGVGGDPLEGFKIRKNGTVTLLFAGGSGSSWEYTYVFQFRRGQYYVIGEDQRGYDMATGFYEKESTNYITGQSFKETYYTPKKSLRKVIRSKKKKEPLVRVVDFDPLSRKPKPNEK